MKIGIVEKQCVCGKNFLTTEKRILAGRGKFCSIKCHYENASRPSGLKYCIKTNNRGWFKKDSWDKHPNFKTGRWAYRKRALKIKKQQCEYCGNTTNILVHHNDGNRDNNKDDNLITVCAKCHCSIHPRKFYGNQYTTKTAT